MRALVLPAVDVWEELLGRAIKVLAFFPRSTGLSCHAPPGRAPETEPPAPNKRPSRPPRLHQRPAPGGPEHDQSRDWHPLEPMRRKQRGAPERSAKKRSEASAPPDDTRCSDSNQDEGRSSSRAAARRNWCRPQHKRPFVAARSRTRPKGAIRCADLRASTVCSLTSAMWPPPATSPAATVKHALA